MNTDFPLTLLYDAACPVCSLEMDHLRQRDTAGRLRLIDLSQPDFDPAAWGATAAELDAEIHGYTADGRVLRGMAALRLAYAAVGLGWVLQPTGFGPLRPVFDAAYRVFARHRQTISRMAAPWIDALRAQRARRVARQMARCQQGVALGGACHVNAGRAPADASADASVNAPVNTPDSAAAARTTSENVS